MKQTRALTLFVSSVVVVGTPAVVAATTTAPPTTTTVTAAPATTSPATTAAATTAPGAATTAAAPTTPAAVATTAAAAATTVAAAADQPGPTLGAGATAAEMQAAAEAIIGPTDDAFGRLSGLAPFSLAIPTPAGSFLQDFDIQYFDDDYTATMELQLGVPAADAIAAWQAAATAAGLVLEEDSTAASGDVTQRELRFNDPGNTEEVFLAFTVTDAPDVDTARIQFEDVTTLEQSEFTRSWSSLVSLPSGGEWSYGVFRYDAEWATGSVGTSYDYTETDAATMKAAIIATMPANGFSYDAASDTDPEGLTLAGDPATTAFSDVTMRFHQFETTVTLTATGNFAADTPPIPEPAAPDPAATTAAPATTVAAGPTVPVSTAPPVFAPAVPAGATTAQILELVRGIFGPTTDAPAELSPFIPVLSGLPTPPDAVVEAFDLSSFELSDANMARGQVLFTTATPPAELLALYASAAAALGMTETANATTSESDGVTTAVAYEADPSDPAAASFDLHVVDGETDYVQLTINTPTQEAVATNINAAIVTASGLPSGGEVEDSLSVSLGWFSDDVNMYVTVGYPGDEATVKASVDASILAAGGTADVEASSDSYFYYAMPDGGEVQVSFYDDGEGTTSASVVYSLSLG